MQWVNKSIGLMCLAIIIGVLVGSVVSAATFDNRLKSYDEETKTLIIDDNFGLGGDLVKVKLEENTYICGVECSAILNVTIYKDDDNFLSDLVFEQVEGGGGVSDYKFEYISGYSDMIVDDFVKDCSNEKDVGHCIRKITGTHTEKIPIWSEFNPERKLPIGDYVIKLTGKKRKDATIDWIPTFYGEEITQWAYWASTDPAVYWRFNEADGANSANDTLGLKNLTLLDLLQTGFATGKLANSFNATTTNGNEVLNASGGSQFAFGTNDFTIAYWFNGTAGAGEFNVIRTEKTQAQGWAINRVNPNKMLFIANGTVIDTSTKIIFNELWNRVIWVREGTGSNEFKIYINNENTDNATLATDILNDTGNFTIQGSFEGYSIDDLQIYNNYGWSVADVEEDWNSGAGREANDTGEFAGTISLNLPANAIQQLSGIVTFNCSSTGGSSNAINVSLYLDGLINTTSTGNATTLEVSQTLTGIGVGSHNWTCTSRNEQNNFGETTNRTFEITNFAENSQTFNLTTYESSRETFVINVSFNSTEFPVSTATLNYNGTGYAGSTSDMGDNKSYTTSVVAPAFDSIQNVSFYWSFILTNITGANHFNSTLGNNQTVDVINASILDKPYNIQFLNFTTYDQDNLTQITTSISSTLRYGISTIIQNLSYQDNTGGNYTTSFGFNASHLTFLVSGNLEFTKADYVTNNYVFPQQFVSNSTTNISVYLLNSSHSTSFIVQVKDSSFDNVVGATVEIQRFYPSTNTWITIESKETNVEGKTIGHFVVEDVNYRFLVYVGGSLILTSTPTLIFCEESPCTITLRLPDTTGSPFDIFEPLDSYTSTLIYSSDTETFTFTYADTNTTTQGGRLRIIRTDLGVASNVEICNELDGSGTGVLTCDISSEINGTYIATGFSNRTVDENRVTERIAIRKIRDIVTEIGVDGLLWSGILFISIVLLWLFSPAMAIIASIFSLIAITLLGLVVIPPLSLFALIAIAGVLLWIITR